MYKMILHPHSCSSYPFRTEPLQVTTTAADVQQQQKRPKWMHERYSVRHNAGGGGRSRYSGRLCAGEDGALGTYWRFAEAVVMDLMLATTCKQHRCSGEAMHIYR